MLRVVTLLLLIGCLTASAQTQLTWSVLGSGGVVGSPQAGRVLSATLGQPLIGIGSITDGSEIYQGFWLPLDLTTDISEDGLTPQSNDVTNYPNPFANSTTIHIGGHYEGQAHIRVFDATGNVVRELDVDVLLTGGRDVVFDGLNSMGQPLSSGVYPYEVIIRSTTGKEARLVDRMTIIR